MWLEQSKTNISFINIKKKHTFYINNCSYNIFPHVTTFLCVKAKLRVFSLSRNRKNRIPCFPCAVAALLMGRSLML